MLRVERLSKSFGTGRERVAALMDVDLHLERGGFLTIIGSNGAGKSTLLNLIAGTFPPTSGRIILDERDVTGIPAYRRARWIGRIVQDPVAGTVPSMTVAENLALAMKRSGRLLRRAITRSRRREMLAAMERLGMGLEDRLNDPVSTLSGGERQALTVAMATLAPPDLLLLDEHTASLDPANAAAITRMTGEFVERMELTTIMVTHNMEQAIAWGDRLVMMHKGRIVHSISGEEKRKATVTDLVDLFSRRHIADDELLLGIAY